MTTAIMLRDPQLKAVAFTKEFEAQVEAALQQAASVTSCKNAEENTVAVAVVQSLKFVLSSLEKARQEMKRPLLDYGTAIDSAVRGKAEDTNGELTRVNALVTALATLEMRKQREAENAQKATLLQLERERAAEIAKAPTLEAIEKVQEEFGKRAAIECPPPAPITLAKGQSAPKEQWNFEVTDIWAIVRANPICVKVEVLRGQVLSLLEAGVKVPGVRAWQEVKTQVRPGRQPEAIPV